MRVSQPGRSDPATQRPCVASSRRWSGSKSTTGPVITQLRPEGQMERTRRRSVASRSLCGHCSIPLTSTLFGLLAVLGMGVAAASAAGPGVTVDPLTREKTLAVGHISDYRRPFPVVEPDDSHTKLQMAESGVEAISRITTPIAAVAVIGPYRSGKSFLLNQLLSLSCEEGFGVGHMRDTKTKGIWVWGEPVEMEIDGRTVSVLYLDTEGFESVGKSSVYDDRIFALAAILSSVLVYNLPETVKENDIAKLSFAVELAQEFYGRVKGRKETFTPAKLLWLIQRDFLEGKTVTEMVQQALKPVTNPDGDKDVDAVNEIRASLSLMAENSTAFGLVQPHLQRTKLCDMSDSQLEPKYVQQREQLKKLVKSLIAPKIMSAKLVNGKEFVELLRKTLDALNKGKIPSAGSVVETFNREVVDRCIELYESRMAKVVLPVADARILSAHKAAQKEALEMFEEERFGRKESQEMAAAPLINALEQMLEKMKKENLYQSASKCEQAYALCEDQVDKLQGMRLPSMAKFEAGVLRCNNTVEASCFGPSKASYHERLQKMWTRERAQFQKEYNQRLFNWLVVASLVLVVVGRFIIKWVIIEVAAWALFVFLEAYTRLFFSVEGLYYNQGWRTFVQVWESIVYNPLVDLDTWGIPLAWGLLISLVAFRVYRFRSKRPTDPLLPRHSSPSNRSHRSE